MLQKLPLLLVKANEFKRKILISVLLVFSIFIMQYWFISLIEHRYQQDAKVETLQRLNVVRASLETILNNNLSMIKGMSIAIASNPNLDQASFNRYSKEILRSETLLLNIAAAPNMVIKYVYPLAGNEKVIGLNYNRNEKQRDEAQIVKTSRSVVVAGPVDLVQGGRAFIGRAPVFYFDEKNQQEKFWGIVSSVMKLDLVLDVAGFIAFEQQQAISLRKKNTAERPSKMIYGPSDIFNAESVVIDLTVVGETWELAAKVTPSAIVTNTINAIRLAFLLFGLLIAVITGLSWRRSSERKRLIKQLTYREGMLERVGGLASVGGWEYHLVHGFTFCSKEIYNLLEIPLKKSDISPADLFTMVDANHRQALQSKVDLLLNNACPIDIEVPITCANQHRKWIQIQAFIQGSSAQDKIIQGVAQDITQRKENTELIKQQANYDSLTHLSNRTLFDEQLEYTVENSKRSQQIFALLYIDLDRFKLINDSLGHEIGDKVLIEVASRLHGSIRESDTLSRRSGDEFTLIINHLHHVNAADVVASNILKALKEALYIDENQIYISASIGITLFPDDGESAAILLKNADQAMYSAKNKGRNTFSYFTTQMQISSDRQLRLHRDMIDALEHNLLDVHYQPIINLVNGDIVECEALIRWNHPELGPISPEELVALAEEVGLIGQLGNFVMQQAINDIKELNYKYETTIGIAINKSYREFISSNDVAPKWLEQIQLEAQHCRMTVEITESLLIENDDIFKTLEQLRGAGIKIAIDDFGTGYSSLSYLRRFPIDQLKIDRSFVKDIDRDKEDLALVDIILAMAENLGIKVVAEGVENAAQLALLSQRNCDYCQGFHIAKPMPKSQLEHWLNTKLMVAEISSQSVLGVLDTPVKANEKVGAT